MSCHDIGHGINNIVNHVMKMYRNGCLDKNNTREIITVARKSVHWCDGNEDEAVECMDDTCGCCLRDGAPGEHMFYLYTACSPEDGITWDVIDKMYTDPRKDQDFDLHTVGCTVCAECFDRMLDYHTNRKGAGAEMRAKIEEKGEAHIIPRES